MNRLAIAAATVALLASPARAEDDDATKLAVKLTTAGAATFDTKDARAMAAYYTDDAQVLVTSKDKDTGAIKTEVKRGRGEIEDFYRELFKDAGTIHSKNTVTHARRIDPDLLLIGGDFQPDLVGSDVKVPFVQVRVRQGDKWLIANLQIFIVPKD